MPFHWKAIQRNNFYYSQATYFSPDIFIYEWQPLPVYVFLIVYLSFQQYKDIFFNIFISFFFIVLYNILYILFNMLFIFYLIA